MLGAVAPPFIHSDDAEAALKSRKVTLPIAEQAAEMAAACCRPITDTRASAEYRRDLIKALTKRGILEAAKQRN